MKADKRLAEIRERVKKATRGPWHHVFGLGGGISTATEQIARVNTQRPALKFEHDAAFIAHACQDIPWLLTRIDQLERLVPEAALLDEVADEAMLWELSSPDDSTCASEVRRFAATIRKYREGKPGQIQCKEST